MAEAFPSAARYVVIGGGIMGSSTAYHLALNGERDVLVLERSRLQSGTTWHAAGLVNALRPSANFTRLIRYSIDLYSRLEAETGQRRHVLPCRGVRRDPRQQTEGHRSNRVRWIRIQSLAGASEEAGRHRRAVVCESRRRSQGLASVVPFRALRASPSPAPKTTRAPLGASFSGVAGGMFASRRDGRWRVYAFAASLPCHRRADSRGALTTYESGRPVAIKSRYAHSQQRSGIARTEDIGLRSTYGRPFRRQALRRTVWPKSSSCQPRLLKASRESVRPG